MNEGYKARRIIPPARRREVLFVARKGANGIGSVTQLPDLGMDSIWERNVSGASGAVADSLKRELRHREAQGQRGEVVPPLLVRSDDEGLRVEKLVHASDLIEGLKPIPPEP